MIAVRNETWAAPRAALKRFVGKRVSNREDADDIVQISRRLAVVRPLRRAATRRCDARRSPPRCVW
jgi:hypothetical protein